jgi:ABC-type sulfate transport system permease subunit
MSDRTQLAIGNSTFSVTRLTKRAMQVVISSALTAFAAFVILLLNNVLTARSGFSQGFDAWYAFIRRSDILGTIALTAMVTVLFIYWQRDRERR